MLLMQEYLQIVWFQITSTRNYIVSLLSQKRWREIWVVEYVIVFWIAYLVAIYLLHKVYRFFLISTLKQKANYFLACDTILYEFQLAFPEKNDNIEWIKEIIKKGSYEESYDMFLEKSLLLESENLAKQLKKSHQSYINSRRRKMLCWVFLTLVTLWIYKIFLEN